MSYSVAKEGVGMVLEPPLTPSAPPLEREGGAFVFFSYAHRDKGFRDRLEDHLSNLKYRGLITTWYEKAIELDPTVTLNYGDLMHALRALGRKEEAERVQARAKQLGDEDLE